MSETNGIEFHRLRDFWASPASGWHKGLHWRQTMGAIVLSMRLRGPIWDGVTASEFQVRLCELGLRVTNKRRPEASDDFLSSALNGDFPHEVLVRSSWWSLENDDDENSKQGLVLVIHLVKAKDKSWSKLFLDGNAVAASNLSSDWVTLQAGQVKQDDAMVSGICNLRPEVLLEEISITQTEDLVTIRLFLCQRGLEEAKLLAPMSRLWGLDLTEETLKVFLRGHEDNPLLVGRLGGKVMPRQTDWSMVKTTCERETGADGVDTRQTRAALSIQLRKGTEHRTHWNSIVSEEFTCGVSATNAESNVMPEIFGALDDDGEVHSFNDLAKESKARGDDAFRKQQWSVAVEHYTNALSHTPDSEKLLSNRSAAYMELGLCQQALDDAMRCGEISPEWPKAFFRQGVALRALKRYDMALSAFSEGLGREPGNPNWQSELDETERLKEARKAALAARTSKA